MAGAAIGVLEPVRCGGHQFDPSQIHIDGDRSLADLGAHHLAVVREAFEVAVSDHLIVFGGEPGMEHECGQDCAEKIRDREGPFVHPGQLRPVFAGTSRSVRRPIAARRSSTAGWPIPARASWTSRGPTADGPPVPYCRPGALDRRGADRHPEAY